MYHIKRMGCSFPSVFYANLQSNPVRENTLPNNRNGRILVNCSVRCVTINVSAQIWKNSWTGRLTTDYID
jgi:hypothetical protein